MAEQFTVKKVWDRIFGKEWIVESMDYFRKRKGILYKVKRYGDGHYTCSCQSWLFKSGTMKAIELESGKIHERTCKHIRFILEGQEGIRIRKSW